MWSVCGDSRDLIGNGRRGTERIEQAARGDLQLPTNPPSVGGVVTMASVCAITSVRRVN